MPMSLGNPAASVWLSRWPPLTQRLLNRAPHAVQRIRRGIAAPGTGYESGVLLSCMTIRHRWRLERARTLASAFHRDVLCATCALIHGELVRAPFSSRGWPA